DGSDATVISHLSLHDALPISLMLISNAYLSKRENEKSLEYALRARDYLPEIVSTISKINVLNTIGMQHQQLRIYDKAIEYLDQRSEEHTSELQSRENLVCRLL